MVYVNFSSNLFVDKIYEMVYVKIRKLTEMFLVFSNNNTCDNILTFKLFVYGANSYGSAENCD